ncbi:hypothetical protein HC031_03370 [Planosporangium thailandense]|uniref:Uncharacterized protein n=1 Tax=Planosporangium thailandense TaxID=765197 RepID=A0ABX0XTK2_9ACTN|nr:hypothetical protein [Planosporangium thailandense]NJC68770.1 hypothetical protein [Planosporangium thailandense]
MYSWIWRHLPFGLPGRIIGSLVLIAAAGALLWYAVFPNIEQYMPFTDGQVTGTDGGGTGADTLTGPSAGPSDHASLPPPDVIPYSTVSNAPAPSTTR